MTGLVSWLETLLLLVAWGGTELLLRRRGLNWRLNSGVTVRLQRLGNQPRLALCGALLLLWIPHLLNVGQGTNAGQPSPGTAASVTPAPVQTSHGAQSPNISGTGGNVNVQYGSGPTATPDKRSEKKR